MAGTVLPPSSLLNGADGDARARAGAPPGHSTATDPTREVAAIQKESGFRDAQRPFVSVCRELLAQRQLDDRLLVAASEEGESAAKKRRDEGEESSHRGEILRDFSAETQTDSLLDIGVP